MSIRFLILFMDQFGFEHFFVGFSYFLFSFSVRFVLKELLQTERDYVKSLGEVVEVSSLDCSLIYKIIIHFQLRS